VSWLLERFAEEWGAPLDVRAPQAQQPAEAPVLTLDAHRAANALGWTPRWDLEEAVRLTVDWYRRFAAGEDARDLTLGQIAAYPVDDRAAASPA
jgi:CDP-glucose 4,6-dehydratase